MAPINIRHSTYKNCILKDVKKEQWIQEIQPISCLSESSNSIKTNCKFAIYCNQGQGSIGVIPFNKWSRNSIMTTRAMSTNICDMELSPFDDKTIILGGEDGSIAIHEMDEHYTLNYKVAFNAHKGRVINLNFHPNADHILASAAQDGIKTFDLNTLKELGHYNLAGKTIQSLAWNYLGNVILSTWKDKAIRLIDPRANSIIQEINGHANARIQKILALGDTEKFMTTGFSNMNESEYAIYDFRQLSNSPLCRSRIGSGASGIHIPLYDEDAKLLFLIEKGGAAVQVMEMTKSASICELTCSMASESIQIGAALLPKLAVDVMSGEVDQLLKLTSSSIIPLSCIVPRKSYYEFQEDIFPPTKVRLPALSSEEWILGDDKLVYQKISLDPSKHQSVHQDMDRKQTEDHNYEPNREPNDATFTNQEQAGKVQPKLLKRVQRFRFLNSKLLHPNNSFEGIPNLNMNLPPDSDSMDLNQKYIAIPLSSIDGRLGIIDRLVPGKLNRNMPSISNGASINDFALSQLQDNLCAIGCDDGNVRIWNLDNTTKGPAVLQGTGSCVNRIKFHCLADNIVAFSALNVTNRGCNFSLWDLTELKEKICHVNPHSERIYDFSFNNRGNLVASLGQDSKYRIIDPRAITTAIIGDFQNGGRVGRICWLNMETQIIISSYKKLTQREFKVFDVRNPNSPVLQKSIDAGPGLLRPHYDSDLNLLYMTAKGDTSIRIFELNLDENFAYELDAFKGSVAQQAVCFIKKQECNVKEVELARCYRLTKNNIEIVSFDMPRTRKEYFQDDLYPDYLDYGHSVLDAEHWFSGTDGQLTRLNLCPPDMTPLSKAPLTEVLKNTTNEHKFPDTITSTMEEQKQKVVESLFQQVRDQKKDNPLPQDLMEGVEEAEWE